MADALYPSLKRPLCLTLDRAERQFVLDSPAVSPHLLKRIRVAPLVKGKPVFRFTFDEAEELYDALAAEATAGPKAAGRRLGRQVLEKLDAILYGKIEQVADGFTGSQGFAEALEAVRVRLLESGMNPGEIPPPEALEFLAAAGVSRGQVTVEQLPEYLLWMIGEYAHQPQDVLGGLSFGQFSRLVTLGWEDETGPLCINRNLEEEELIQSDIFNHARTLLSALKEAGGTKATAAGNLNRKFVAGMFEEMNWRSLSGADFYDWDVVRNEMDFFPLHILRVVLELSGLMRKRSGWFRVTRKGERMLSGRRAGALFSLLFVSFFRKLNLAYLDCLPETPLFQDSIPYALYMFSNMAPKWSRPDEVTGSVLLPALRELLPDLPSADLPTWMVESRLIRPLHLFDLIHCWRAPAKGGAVVKYKLRKSPLFDRFLRFQMA